MQSTGDALKKPSGSRTARIYGKPPTEMLIYDVVNLFGDLEDVVQCCRAGYYYRVTVVTSDIIIKSW